MDNSLLCAVHYIFSKSNKSELTVRLLLDILYLGDWKSALEKHGKTISNLHWVKYECSPFSDEILDILKSTKDFQVHKITADENHWIIKPEIDSNDNKCLLSERDKSILDFVTDRSLRSESPDELVNLTYPMFISDEDETTIDMKALAKDYIRNVRPRLRNTA